MAAIRAIAAALSLAAAASAPAPPTFAAVFNTTLGIAIRVNVTRALAPTGADRLFELLSVGYYNDNGFVRIEESAALGPFVIQWGIASDPAVSARYAADKIADDPVLASNVRGSVAFAADSRVPNSRSSMIFVNLGDNSFLDALGFAPFGVLADDASWAALAALNRAYGESIYLPMAFGMGSDWIRANYPGLSFTTTTGVEGTINVAAGTDAAGGAGSSDESSLRRSSAASAAAAAPAAVLNHEWARKSERRHSRPERSTLATPGLLPEVPTADIAKFNSAGTAPRSTRSLRTGAGAPSAYTVRWFGNTWGGGPDQFKPANASWVSYSAEDIFADYGSGQLYTNVPWDEGTRECGIYDANGTVRGLAADLHGWSRSGGYAVTATADRIYVGMSQAPLSYIGPLRDYPANDTWYCVRAYTREGVPVPAGPSGHGWDGSMVVVCSNCSHITGLAASPDGSSLYVSSPGEGLIKQYNTSTWALLRSWSLPGGALPGKLAIEVPGGTLWAAQWLNMSGAVWPYTRAISGNGSIFHYDGEGRLLPEVISDVSVPSDLAYDGDSHSLLVADNGAAQVIAQYALPAGAAAGSSAGRSASAAVPVPRTMSIGVPGGILAGPAPGSIRPDAFYGLAGVAALSGGDIIVSNVGYTANMWGSGLDLRRLRLTSPSLREAAGAHRAQGLSHAFTPGAPASVAIMYQDLGLEWVDGAAAGAGPVAEGYTGDNSSNSTAVSDGSTSGSGSANFNLGAGGATDALLTFYTQHERIRYNASSGEWAYVGMTVDALRFGDSDMRLHGDSFDTVSVTVQPVGPAGQQHLYAYGMYTQGPAWYKFEREQPGSPRPSSEILIPCGLLSLGIAGSPPWPAQAPTHHPSDGMQWAWQDYSGDGLMQEDEFVAEVVSHKARPYWNVWGSFVATDGSLWLVSEDPWMRAFSAVFNSSTGCAYYDWASPIVNISVAFPPFERMERVVYLPETDTLFVAGFTPAESDWDNVWGAVGRVIQRYDGFLHGARTRGAAWDLPWTNHSCSGVCAVDNAKAMAVLDDIVAVVTGSSGTVYIYNASTGVSLLNMTVAQGGPAMGNYTGWIDTPYGLTLSRVPGHPGEYIAAVEEDGRLKIVTYTFSVK